MNMTIYILLSFLLSVSGCTGKTGDELQAEGVAELRKGNTTAAMVLFRNALEKDPNLVDARYQLARTYVAAGRYEQAEREFQKVSRLNPSLRDIQLDLARLYNHMKKPEMAIKLAEEYLGAHAGSADALEALGIAYAARNMPEEAEERFLRALEKDPGKATTSLELARLYNDQGKKRVAVELLNEIIKREPGRAEAYFLLAGIEIFRGEKQRALELYKRIGEIRPADPEAPYRAGLIHVDSGNIAAADAIAEELIRRFPKKAEGFRLKGVVCYLRNNHPEAIAALQNSIKIQPSALAHHYLGLSLYSRGELENALSQFRQLLDKAPSVVQTRVLVGMILLRQNRLDDAISELGKVLRVDDGNALAHNLLGSAYMAKGMHEEGMKELNRATELDPKIIDAHLKKGIFHLSQGKNNEVEADLRAAVMVAPELLNTRLVLASFHMHRKNSAAALAILKEGISGKKSDAPLYSGMARIMFADKKYSQGVACLQKAKESDPDAFDSYFMLAAHYAGGGEDGKAQQELEAVLRRDARDVKALLKMAAFLERKGRESEAEAYYLRARETGEPVAYLALALRFAKRRDVAKALATLDEAIRHSPRMAAILELKGRLQLQEKQYREALKTFDDIESIAPEQGIPLKINAYMAMNNHREALAQARRAISMHPDSSSGYMLLASVHLGQNNTASAIEELTSGLRIDGRNPRAALMLAEVYAKSGNYPMAMETCGKIMRKHPGYAPAYFAQGTFLEATGRKKEAVKKYLSALAIADNYPQALNNLAYLYADGRGSSEEALRLAEKALSLDPDNPGIMDTMGYAQMKNGRHQEARKTLERAAALLPDNPTINFHLAEVYLASGEKGSALARLQKALQHENFAEARQAKTLLSELNRPAARY